MLIFGNSHVSVFEDGVRCGSEPVRIRWTGALRVRQFFDGHPVGASLREELRTESGWIFLSIGHHDVLDVWRTAPSGREAHLAEVLGHFERLLAELAARGRVALLRLGRQNSFLTESVTAASEQGGLDDILWKGIGALAKAHSVPVLDPLADRRDATGRLPEDVLRADGIHVAPEHAPAILQELSRISGAGDLQVRGPIGRRPKDDTEPGHLASLVCVHLDLPSRSGVDATNVLETVLEISSRLALRHQPRADIAPDTPLVLSGALDSLDLAELWSELHDRFGRNLRIEPDLRILSTPRELADWFQAQGEVPSREDLAILLEDADLPSAQAAVLAAAKRFSHAAERILPRLLEARDRILLDAHPYGFFHILHALCETDPARAARILELARAPGLAFPATEGQEKVAAATIAARLLPASGTQRGEEASRRWTRIRPLLKKLASTRLGRELPGVLDTWSPLVEPDLDSMLLRLELAVGRGPDDHAWSLVERILAQWPGSAACWLHRAKLHLALGDIVSAAMSRDEARRLDPALQGLEDMDRSIGPAPDPKTTDSVESLLEEAQTLLSRGQDDQSLERLERAERLAPDDRRLVDAVAWMHARMGNLSQAQAQATKAVRLWPNDPSTHANLAGILLRRGQFERAESPLRTALSLAPRDIEANLALARVLDQQGRNAEADAFWRRFLSDAPADHPNRREAESRTADPSKERLLWWEGRKVGKEEDILEELAGRPITRGIHTILVVGAHKYQEARLLDTLFPNLSDITLFEPIPPLKQELEARFGHDPRIRVSDFAISDQDGSAVFHVTNNLASSSLLPLGKHKEIFPHVHEIGPLPVRTRKLASALKELGAPDPDMLFIDVQGAEYQVVSGIDEAILAKVRIIYTEASTEPLYEGSRVLDDLKKLLGDRFVFLGFAPLADETPTHGNALFVRSDLVGEVFPESPAAPKGNVDAACAALAASLRAQRAAPADPALRRKVASDFRLATRGASGTPTTEFAEPYVSAIVSVYKAERFLRGCLDDLLAQSLWKRERLEIVVVDTGSPESESDIVREYQARHGSDRIRLIRTDDRRSIYAAWNLGIHAARGEFVTNANADDRHHPEALERLAAALRSEPGADLAYADSLCTRVENETWRNHTAHARFWWPPFDPQILFQGCFVGPHPVWRRSLHERFGAFREDLKIAGDYEFWLRVASRGVRFVHVPQALGLYLEGGAEASNRDLAKSETDSVKHEHWNGPGDPPAELGRGYQAETDPVEAIWSNLCFSLPDRARRIARATAQEHPGAARLEPRIGELHALFQAGKREDALGIVREAISGPPPAATAPSGEAPLARALREADERFGTGDVQGAIALLEPFAEGGELSLLTALGWLETRRGDRKAALSWYEQAARRHPEDTTAWSNLAVVQLEAKDLPAAESSLRQVLSISPMAPDALIALARVLEALGRAAEAAEVALRFCAGHPSHPQREAFLATYAGAPPGARGIPFPKDHCKGRIVALMTVYNEGDLIRSVIGDLIANGIDVYLLDNASTDDTVEQASHWLGKGLLHIESYPADSGYPERTSREFALKDILRREEDVAAHLGADWYLHVDADEFRESPWEGLTLSQAIRKAESEGYSAINYELYNFRPTRDDFPRGGDPRGFLTHWEPGDWFDSVQIKTWKHPGSRVDLASTGGHNVQFPGRKVCPVPFLLRHYPIRGEEHGRRKILGERLDRFSQAERAQGWHIQYEEYRSGKKSFLHDPARLSAWDDGKPAREAIFARLDADRGIVRRAGGSEGSPEIPLNEFCQAVDARTGANLSSAPASLAEADTILRGLVDQISQVGPELERMDSPLLRRIWFSLASVRRAQARLSGEFWIANHFSKALSHLAKGMNLQELSNEAMRARSWGDAVGEKFLLDLARKAAPEASPLVQAIDARSWSSALPTRTRSALPERPQVSIVIPVHNGTELTRNCLTSLFSAPSAHGERIVVVDDASTDGTNAYLRGLRDSGRIELVEHGTNLGFAASCNDGAKAASGDILVFLNNDTIVQQGWLDALVDELVRDDSVGIAGSRLLYPDGRIQHAGMVWEWKEGRPHPEHVFRRHPGDAPEVNICLDYPSVTGACMAIPARLFEELGGFSPEFGMYCEDVDLCLRVWDRNLRVRYVPESVLFHLESATPIDLQARAEKSRSAADQLRASWKGRWPAAFASMPSWMWPDQARQGSREARNLPAGSAPRARIGFDARTLSVPDSVVRGIGNYAWHHLLALLQTRPGTPITCLHDDTEKPPSEIVERSRALGAVWEPWSSRSAADFDLFHTPDPMHVYPGYASPFQRFGSTRTTATFHDIIPIRVYEGRIANWPAYLARLDELVACGTILLCNSEFTRKDLLEAVPIPAGKAIAVMAGFNASASGRNWSRQEGDALLSRLGIRKPFFLHVGAADPHKNFESSLAACQALGKNRPLQLVVVGKLANSLGSMRDQIRQANLQDVVFTDYLEREELELLYSRAVATLFLSRYEGFGFPALEAMASGCPVIASDAASIPEIAGDAALSHKPDDLAGIASSMLRLMDDPSLRDDLIARGRKRSAMFTWVEVARRTWEAWDHLLAAPAPEPKPAPVPAQVQWISPIWDPSGYADESRGFVKHLATTDLGVGLLAWGRHSETFRQAASKDDRRILDGAFGRELAQGRVAVLDIPASALGRVPGGGVHVGRTTFETDGLPADWVERCNTMDEIWVPGAFNRDTFARAGVRKPILVVGEGVDVDRFRPGLEPLPLGGAARSTTFLSIFEWTHRKGPDLLLAAWANAFTASDDVRLVLRCYPPNQIEGDPAAWVEAKIDEELSRVGSSRARCAPIVVLARQVPDADMPRLYAAADVYVAPSRGEGWGRPHMEAMSSGIAVIATRWSGNLEFQNDDNSWLVGIDGLEKIDDREEYPFYRGQKWAKPSVESLVSHLRRAATDPQARRRLGDRARRDMVELWDWKRIAPLAELRIREILQGIPAERSALGTSTRPTTSPATATTSRPPSTPGAVRWCGQMFNHSGYSRLSREAVAALMDAGMAVTADPLNPDPSWFLGISSDDRNRWTELLRRDPIPGTLVCCDIPLDATGTNELFRQMEEANPGCAHRVGWTMFESDRLPDGWAQALNRLDEVWVPSEFNRRTFACGGVDASRIHVVPPGIDVSRFSSARPMDIRGPRRATTFLSVFQWTRRKGWDVLLKAWAKAFKPQADVRLVLRCHPFGKDARPMGEVYRQSLAELGLTESDMAPVLLLDDFVAESELPSLYAASDVFVLPTRGEGWCFPYLEAMAAGKPCIATAWGASMDFLDAGCCWLAAAGRTAPVQAQDLLENRYLGKDHRWADPDPDEIAGFLREAASDVPLRLRKGQMALHHAAKWNRHRTAQAIATRLGALETGAAPRHSDLARSIESTAKGILERTHGGVSASPGRNPTVPGAHPGQALHATAAGILARAGRVRHATAASAQPAVESAPSAAPVASLSIRWEGSQLVHHSLANVNREVCLRLAKRGHDLSLIPFEPDQFAPGDDPDLSILATLRDAPLEGPCQVHVRHQWPPRLDAPFEGRWVVVQPWEFGSPPRDWIPAFRDRVDEIWCYTRYVKSVYLEAGIPEHKLAVVPLGVDVDKYRPGLEPLPELPRDPSRTTFLFVGGTIARKGFDCLLNAWARAFTASDPVRLVVKGMGGGTFYKGQTGDAMVRDLNASGKAAPVILFDRELDPRDVPRIYACADVLVHPYRGEGFGLPIAEAMACGLPCIATRGGAADDFCSDAEAWMVDSVRVPVPGGKVGPFETVAAPWWLEPDIPSLVAALRSAMSDPTLRGVKGRAARERIAAHFTWEHTANHVERRLADLASRPAPYASSATKTKFVSALEKLSMRIHTGGGLEVHTPVLPGAGVASDDVARLDALLVRAEAAAARRDFTEAEDLTRRAVEEHPNQHMAWLARAMILRGLGKFRKAMEAVDRSLELEDSPDALLEAIQIHLAAGETAPARKREKALKDRHATWLKATRELFRARAQAWPLDALKPAQAAKTTAPRKGKR